MIITSINETKETHNEKYKDKGSKVEIIYSPKKKRWKLYLTQLINDVMKYYTLYGKKNGFVMAKRSLKKENDGEVMSETVACDPAEDLT